MASPRPASIVIAALKKLIDKAGNNYYHRIRLVDECLQDKVWIASSFNADEYAAAQYLEDEFLHDLSGSMTVWQLLTCYRKYPNEASWKAKKYNLRALYEDARPKTDPAKFARTIVKKAEFEAMEQRAQEASFQVKQLKQEAVKKESELDTLRNRVSQLERENIRLVAQVEELEKLVHKRMTA